MRHLNPSTWKRSLVRFDLLNRMRRTTLLGVPLLFLLSLGVFAGSSFSGEARSEDSPSVAGSLADSLFADSTQEQVADALRIERRFLVPEAPAEEEKTTVRRTVGTGTASYYGRGLAGNPTANGETFDPRKMTAAHPSLPFGARVRVTNLRNGESVVVRINDRGPYGGNRIIDVSRRAAEELEMVRRGLARVKVELMKKKQQRKKKN